MKKLLFNIFAIASVLFLSASCEQAVDKNVAWPEWASRPVVSEMAVTASSARVVAGETVHFFAKVSDSYNDLKEYTLEIKYGSGIVFSETRPVSGSEAVIDMDFEMPFAANLDDGEFYPEVSLTVVNVVNGKVVKRVANEDNVPVTRPSIPDILYIVDNQGGKFVLEKKDGYLYNVAAGTDLSSLGTSFRIASKVNGSAIDYSGIVWGYKDGRLSVVKEAGDNAIPTPDNAGFGFKELGIDAYSFQLSKLINFKYVLDIDALDDTEESQVKYKSVEPVKLYRDCEVEFVGFGDLASMLQPDRWEILSSTTAKFTAQTSSWGFYYSVSDGWLVMNERPWNVPDQVWITGIKACFPLGNDASEHEFKYLEGDGKSHTASFSMVRGDDGIFRCLVYLKNDFALQLYRWVKWSSVVSMESATPKIAKVNDLIYIAPGDEFSPGVYMVTCEFVNEGNNSGDGATAVISIEKYNL